ncbi:iron acquisition protein FupA [Francisella tularensis]|uniref:iron acquisition protein FupA n=1 Tax=Francisella tularensis TaxID=263 RepID=UPI001C0EACCD|nr:iron acquisition protein FupA [Francisella tularensis]MBK2062237.1 iron acquisition protein FupA [Francisella tularensis subsp. tularensis]
MVRKFKKTCLIVSSLLACSGLAYSEDSPQVVSQGGPLGATSIGDQNLGQPDPNASGASSTTQTTGSNLNDRELLLKLQQQVQQLQGQLQQLKAQGNGGGLQNTYNGSSQFTTYSSKVDGNKNPRTLGGNGESKDLSQALIGGQTSSDIMGNVNASNSIINLASEPLGGVFNQKGGINVGGAPAITTQGQVTYLGSYSGNNSIPIGQISSNLFASTLLGQREKFDDYSVFFGGFIEADAQAWFGSAVTKVQNAGQLSSNGQNIYLTSANLYFLSNLGHYVTAQFDFDTNESGSFSLGNAFVIFGNLDISPFFVTAGRNKLSVGSYGGGGTWTSGITKFLSPNQVTNVSIDYKDQVWNANIAVFGSDDRRANFSTGLFYADSWTPNLAAGFNVGYVFNIAGAGNSSIANSLANLNRSSDNVGALNVDGNLTYAIWDGFLNLGAGWASTTTKEDFNNNGGSVLAGAWYGALNYSAILGGRNTNFGVTYGQSYNAAAIPMETANASPTFGQTASGIKQQLIFSAQRAYFDDNVLFGPEYAYQRLYTGEHMNTITLDMSVYV